MSDVANTASGAASKSVLRKAFNLFVLHLSHQRGRVRTKIWVKLIFSTHLLERISQVASTATHSVVEAK